VKSVEHISTLYVTSHAHVIKKIKASLYRITKMCRWIGCKCFTLCMLCFRETSSVTHRTRRYAEFRTDLADMANRKKKVLSNSNPGLATCSHSPYHGNIPLLCPVKCKYKTVHELISGFHRAFLKSITFIGRLMHSIA